MEAIDGKIDCRMSRDSIAAGQHRVTSTDREQSPGAGYQNRLAEGVAQGRADSEHGMSRGKGLGGNGSAP